MIHRRFAVLAVLVGVVLIVPCFAQQSQTEKEIRDLEERMNAVYAANDLPSYFAYYGDDFTQWLPKGWSDLSQYKKEWTAFIGSGGSIESAQPLDMHIRISPSGDRWWQATCFT